MTWYQRAAQWWMSTMAWDDRVLHAISATAHEVVAMRAAVSEQIAVLGDTFLAQQESLRTELAGRVEDAITLIADRVETARTDLDATLHERIQLVTLPAQRPQYVTTERGPQIHARGCADCERLVSAYATDRDGLTRCLDCHEAQFPQPP